MRDILQDIHQYNQQLTISQVVTFFERKGVTVTKSMIQNYVRDGLLAPPLSKRHYTPKHLATLAVINELKTVYEMATVKAALMPLMDGEGISLEVYKRIIQKTESLAACWHKNVEPFFLDIKGKEEILILMAHSVDLKDEGIRRLSINEKVVPV